MHASFQALTFVSSLVDDRKYLPVIGSYMRSVCGGKWAHPSKLTCVIVEGRERPGDSHQQLSFSHHISLCASWNDNNFRIEISILKSSCRACVCVCASLPTCRKILSINWNREMIRLNATLSGLKINHYEMRYTFEYEEASSMSFESWYSSHQKFFCEEIQSFFLNGNCENFQTYNEE